MLGVRRLRIVTKQPYQNPLEASSGSRIFLFSVAYMSVGRSVGLMVRTGPPGQTKNDTDLKFGTHIL